MSATDSSLILKNHEGDKIYLTTTGNHGKFILDFTAEMGRKSLGTPLEDSDDYCPIRPDEPYHRRDGALGYGLFTHHDQREIADYIKAKSIWDAQCEQVINYLRAALQDLVRTAVETRIVDPWRGNRTCIRQVVTLLAQLYDDWSDLKGQRNYSQMASIDVFTSVESAQFGLAKLDAQRLEREGWQNDPAPYTDKYYRSWLLQRMRDWDILVILRSTIILDNTLTFAQCRERLHTTIADKAEQKDEAVERQRHITTHTSIDSSVTLTTNMAGTIRSVTGSVGGGAGLVSGGTGSVTGGAMTGGAASITDLSANKVVGDPGFTCYNCGQTDHAVNDCKALWCSRCGTYFSFYGCQGFHTFSNCPMWNRKRTNNDIGEQPQQRPRMMQWIGQQGQQRSQQQQRRTQLQQRVQPQYQHRGQQSQPQLQRQQQQFQPREQLVTQPHSVTRPSVAPRSRFAGHVGADDNPIFDEALEAAGLQNMTQDQALAFSARIQSYANYAATSAVQDMPEEEQGGPQDYTQPWEHTDSDY